MAPSKAGVTTYPHTERHDVSQTLNPNFQQPQVGAYNAYLMTKDIGKSLRVNRMHGLMREHLGEVEWLRNTY
jgi:hypothetical protein